MTVDADITVSRHAIPSVVCKQCWMLGRARPMKVRFLLLLLPTLGYLESEQECTGVGSGSVFRRVSALTTTDKLAIK